MTSPKNIDVHLQDNGELVSYNAAMRTVHMPDRIKRLKISPRGFPVPFFVAWIDGVPDFRVIRPYAIAEAWQRKCCWICGEPLGRTVAIMLGPMCVIERCISEPPSHRDCAVFAAIACPFLANPRMQRHEAGLPDDKIAAPGNAIMRNPGACGVWLTRRYAPYQADDGVLFTFDDPTEVLWYREGRAATRDEVLASIQSGLPLLMAEAEKGGPALIEDTKRRLESAMQYLPDPVTGASYRA